MVVVVLIRLLCLRLFVILDVNPQVLFLPLAFPFLLHPHLLSYLHLLQVLLLLLLPHHVLLRLLDSQADKVAQFLEHFPIQFFQVYLIDSLVIPGLEPSVPVADVNHVFEIVLRQNSYFLCEFLFLGGCDGSEVVEIGVLVGGFGIFTDFALVGDLVL